MAKPDTLRAAAVREDRRVDAHEPAFHVDERAAGVARIDGRVGLDEIFIHAAIGHAVLRADDAFGHGLADAERIADGQHHVADADFLAVGEGHGGQVICLDLHDGYICFWVGADNLAGEFAPVGRAPRGFRWHL